MLLALLFPIVYGLEFYGHNATIQSVHKQDVLVATGCRFDSPGHSVVTETCIEKCLNTPGCTAISYISTNCTLYSKQLPSELIQSEGHCGYIMDRNPACHINTNVECYKRNKIQFTFNSKCLIFKNEQFLVDDCSDAAQWEFQFKDFLFNIRLAGTDLCIRNDFILALDKCRDPSWMLAARGNNYAIQNFAGQCIGSSGQISFVCYKSEFIVIDGIIDHARFKGVSLLATDSIAMGPCTFYFLEFNGWDVMPEGCIQKCIEKSI
ncbi:hypothetical protein HDV04_001173 [Boothiomyces sp. JEL0838]|nr:hypothetical protein HDV04_001173 [Boothiomyces sp. JEL0838]